MPDEQNGENNDDRNEPSSISKWIAGILGTIVLGAIGSGLWDLVFKPGFGGFSRWILGLSSVLDDAVFSTAALDPTPLPALIILILFGILPVGLMGTTLGYLFMKKIGKSRKRSPKRRAGNVSVALLLAFSLLFCAGSFFAVQVTNNSIFVWRVFQRNLDICAVYCDGTHIARIRADFRRMTNRSDFRAIQTTLNKIADENKVMLEWYALNGL